MLKITTFKKGDSKQELEVSALVKEMSIGTYATTSGEFEIAFKQLLKGISKSNNFSADLLYTVTPRNEKAVEIWKLKVNGEPNYKMFMLEFIDSK